ncbi:gasdermin Eb isoform X2 [Acipenser ruthenus]|uniref:gasdermin Eb isoform X2 n=1 Tax=Acipenser ruthenus TaxID=7906 RepID=UPI00145B8A13|nr:gasdermin Eb isoform X2 [Acipenser ruthenus]
MFAKATSNFVKQIDSDGELIPVARLNDSDKLQPLCLVIKRKRFWFWQKPKYISSPFTLSDVLTGDKPIKPVVVDSDFLKYEGTFGDIIGGNVETEVGNLNISMEGKGSSKLQSSFGDLRKQEVDVLHLLQDSEERVINMDHPFVQQTRERPNEVFGVLKEKVITTQKCLISEQVQEEGQCGSMLGLRAKRIKVSVQENGNMQKDSSVVLEIPPETVLAYSIIELSIKTDGQYELCLLPDKCGGFEAETRKKPVSPELQSLVDGPMDEPMEPDGGWIQRKRSEDVRNIPSEAPLSVLKQDLEEFKTQFKPFAEMPEDKRSALFKMVNKVLYDKAVLIVVENVLEQLSSGDKPDLTELEELNPSQKACVTALLQAIGYSCEKESKVMEMDSLHRSPCLLTATHFLTSAMQVVFQNLPAVVTCK